MGTKILTLNLDHEDQHQIAAYEKRGGYQAIRKTFKMDPDKVIEEVKASGLRGRGGAGFPTGVKWGFVPKNSGKPVYLLNNADESEPGTFKDRVLLERDPHLCIEGMMIAAWALGSNWSCIYIRGEYAYPAVVAQKAVDEAYAKGYLGKNIFGSGFDLDIVVHRGAGAYICGEETGLIESLEGNKGQPRIKPPFPAVVGVYGAPTVVNNTETLAALPWIIENGASAYKGIGTEKSAGTKLFSASGHINKPGVYEVDLGYSMLEFIEKECGGVWKDRKLKAVIPGGSSVPVLRADELEGVKLDYESIAEAGSMLGSGGFIVMDETTDMVDACENLQHFYTHESCGQCTPCREGARWVEKIVARIGRGEGKKSDLKVIQDVTSQIAGHTICPFGDALVAPVLSFMEKFPEEFNRLLKGENVGPSIDKLRTGNDSVDTSSEGAGVQINFMSELVKLTIDGVEVEVPKGTNLIEAAKKVGFEIPHYCYHPHLSVAGNCRICKVEVEGMPKLQIGCNTGATDGMVVKTQRTSEKVSDSQRATLEFLLINHPLDCTVCDEAGHCKLQDYYYEYNHQPSRFEEEKVTSVKAESLGPGIIYDGERCIMCTRCVRFCDEVTETSELGAFNRGDKSVIGINPGTELDNPLDGSVVDLCPVGALTHKEWRFNTRIWYTSKEESICTGCSTGCNADVHVRDNEVVFVKARMNDEVNKEWMCNEGRYGFMRFQPEERQIEALVKGEVVELEDAIKEASAISKGDGDVAIFLSPLLTLEEVWTAKEFAEKVIGVDKSSIAMQLRQRTLTKEEAVLVSPDYAANARAANFLGLSDGGSNWRETLESNYNSLLQKVRSGSVKRILLVGEFSVLIEDQDEAFVAALKSADVSVSLSPSAVGSEAKVVLPSKTVNEKSGLMINANMRIQRVKALLTPPDESQSEWQLLARIAKAAKKQVLEDSIIDERGLSRKLIKEIGALEELSLIKIGTGGVSLA